MNTDEHRFLKILFLILLCAFPVFAQKQSPIKTVKSFYTFHLSRDYVFDKREIEKRKSFFMTGFYNLLIAEWKRDLPKRDGTINEKPYFDVLPFQPVGEACGNWYRIGKSSVENRKSIVKVKFYYAQKCGNNEFIGDFKIELLKVKGKWLIDDIGNLRDEFNELKITNP